MPNFNLFKKIERDNWLSEWALNLRNKVKGWAIDTWDNIRGWATDTLDTIKEWGVTAINEISNAFTEVKNFFSEYGGTILTILGCGGLVITAIAGILGAPVTGGLSTLATVSSLSLLLGLSIDSGCPSDNQA